MKKFVRKTVLIALVFFLLIEVISRLAIDPLFFYSTNTYNRKDGISLKKIYQRKDTEHVDYLFVGSSRIPATINPRLVEELTNGVAINAGRGNMTPGIHHQAIKNKLKKHPNFLKNAKVFIEYAGPDFYTSQFDEDRFRVFEPESSKEKSMPHLLLPHLDTSSLLTFLRESPNGIRVKIKMLSYQSAAYRASQLINDKFNGFNSPLFAKKSENLVQEGGIRTDKIQFAIEQAKKIAATQKEFIKNNPPLSYASLESSSYKQLIKIVQENGGNVFAYKMPLHSIQKDKYNTQRAQHNITTFESWLAKYHVRIVDVQNFTYSDKDFPDTWHLAKNRRDEFTEKLCSLFPTQN